MSSSESLADKDSIDNDVSIKGYGSQNTDTAGFQIRNRPRITSRRGRKGDHGRSHECSSDESMSVKDEYRPQRRKKSMVR